MTPVGISQAFEKTFRADLDAKPKKRQLGVEEVASKRTRTTTPIAPVDPVPTLKEADIQPAEIIYTRYNQVLREILPTFNQCENQKRTNVKRLVRNWLKSELGGSFDQCVIVTTNGRNTDHQTYGIPQNLMEKFKSWSVNIMKELGMLPE